RVVAGWVLLARCAWDAGHHDRAFAVLRAAEGRLEDSPPGPETAEVISTHARFLMLSGRTADAVARCQEALAHTRACRGRLIEGHVLGTLGPCLVEIGEVDRGIETMRDAVALAEELGDPDLLIRVYNNLAHVLYFAGRLEEAATLG